MNKKSIFYLVCMLSSFNLMMIGQASAATVASGQTVLFNFDCSACTNPIPFSSIQLFFGIDSTTIIADDETDLGTINIFDELNAASPQESIQWRDNLLPSSHSYVSSIFTDGLLSVEYTAIEGSIDVTPYARMYYGSGTSRWRDAPGVLAPVPVPASAWLLGSALIGLTGIAKRKRA